MFTKQRNQHVAMGMAIAAGAGIGVLLSGILGTALFYKFVGAAVGAFISFLAYKWEEVVQAVPHAYRAARGWRIEMAQVKGFVVLVFSILNIPSWCWVTSNIVEMNSQHGSLAIWPAFMVLVSVIFTAALIDEIKEAKSIEVLWENGVSRCVAMAAFPPITALLLLLFCIVAVVVVGMEFFTRLPGWLRAIRTYLVRGAVATPGACMRFVRFIKRFTLELLFRINSAKRVLCLSYSFVCGLMAQLTIPSSQATLLGAIFSGFFVGYLHSRFISPMLERAAEKLAENPS